MSAVDRERWRLLSPYLERALEMEDGERTTWLETLRGDDPALAEELEGLLDERDDLRRAGFLEDNAAIAADDEPLAGEALGAYALVSPIGRGGMGTVWLGRRSDGRFEGTVAVKLLSAALAGPSGQQRFRREGAILARLTHPHIAHLIDAGVSPAGQPYLVLEHVEGAHIDRYCDEHRLPVERRIELFLDVLSAVAHAHANLIVHRDLKPSNVLVSRDGCVKLLDFGIAKLLEGEAAGEATELTREGGRALTPEYAAPEQLTGGPITTATDVYALGVLLYVLLTGRHPAGESPKPAALLKTVLEGEPPRVSSVVSTGTDPGGKATAVAARRGTTPEKLCRRLQGDLDTIVAKALKKDARARYASVSALAEDLQRHLRHVPIGARPDTFGYRAARFVRRHRGAVATGGVAVLALTVATIVTGWQMVEARRQRDAARYQARRAEASSEVMSLMLEELGPGGKPLALDVLLDRGVTLLEGRYGSDPHFTGVMMVQMARRYMDLGRPEKVAAILRRAVAMAEGAGDSEVVASARCYAVRLELDEGRPEAAARALADGTRALAALPDPSVQSRIDCLRARADLRDSEGDPDEAIRALEEARALLERTGETRGLLYTSVLNDLGGIHYGAGRPRDSLAINDVLLLAFERNGRGGTVGMATIVHNRAALLFMLGEPLAAEEQARRARQRVEAFADLEDTTFTFTHARALVRLGRHAEAIPLLRRAADRNRAQRSGAAEARARLELGHALIRDRRFGEANAEFDAAEGFWSRDRDANAGNFAVVRLLRAESALLRSDVEEAGRLVDEARSMLQAPGTGIPLYQMRLHRTAAQVALARGDAAAAEVHGGEAARMAEQIARDPVSSADVGEALLLQARARVSQGDREGARLLAARAASALTNGLGPEHPLVRQARELASAMEGAPPRRSRGRSPPGRRT
jgi:serine/threonine-protein kinase